MKITKYKCDRCGRDIPDTKVIELTVDRPIWASSNCKIVKEAINMDICLYCFGEITKIPIDDFIRAFV